MTIQDIINGLNLHVVTGEEHLNQKIETGYVGDLLSVVMGKANPDSVWVTVQSHVNIIAVATLVDIRCIIVSEGFSVDADAIQKAIEEEIVVLTSPQSSYEIVKQLGQLGI